MKLTLKQAQKIAKIYDLGNVKKVTYFLGGWVNYNFLLETNKGKFVIQILGGKFDEWKQRKMDLEFNVLNYLKSKGFPYEIPQPIKSISGNYLTDFGERKLWVYCFIEGEHIKRFTKKEFQNLAKVVALYHKYIKDMGNAERRDFNNFDWLINNYNRMKKITPRNKLDKLMLENIDFFSALLNKVKKVDFGKLIITHSDFNTDNVLFKNGKISGILDFGNVGSAPLAKDLALAIRRANYLDHKWTLRKQKIFLDSYEKANKLTKKDKELIVPVLIVDACTLFWWLYEGMEKHKDESYGSLIRTINDTKVYVKVWEKRLK